MLKTALKHEEVQADLWDELKKLSPGEKFYSVRQLMKKYSTSQLTVDKALTQFRDDGLLVNRPGQGLFVSERIEKYSSEKQSTILFAVPQWLSHDIDTLEKVVEGRQKEFPDTRLLVHKFDISENIPASLPLIEESVSGVIVMPSGGSISLEDIKTMKSYGLPLVMVGRHLEDFGIHCVGCDDHYLGSLAANYLISRGHKRIGVLVSEPRNRIIESRIKAVQNYIDLQDGVELEIIDCEVKSGELALQKAYIKFSEYISSGLNVSALIGVSGDSLQGAINACLNRGINIPQDLSMVALSMESLTATYHPPITTAAVFFDRQVNTAIEMLGALMDEQEYSDCIYIKPEIIERESVIDFA